LDTILLLRQLKLDLHRLFLHNDEILDIHAKTLSAGQTGLLNGWGVFSTIRVEETVMFAFERHWDRMRHDARLMHVPFPSDSAWLKSRLERLIEANSAVNATLRVAIVRNRGGFFEGPDQTRDFDLIAFTTNRNPWGESVRLAIKPNARFAANEFSGAKVLSWAHNLTWYEEAHQRGYDEVLLLNERGEVAECTSANIFALRGDEIWTPPIGSGCLPGVTRALLLEDIRIPGIRAIERTMLPRDLETADEIFVSSTTRDFLPVREIETLTLRPTRSVQDELAKAFESYRRAYIAAHAPLTTRK
jgi:branched-chain amino acid aminotransferase